MVKNSTESSLPSLFWDNGFWREREGRIWILEGRFQVKKREEERERRERDEFLPGVCTRISFEVDH